MVNGYIRILKVAFPEWNQNATAIANEVHGVECASYSLPIEDINPDCAWVKVEHEGITEQEILSHEEAVAQGMIA